MDEGIGFRYQYFYNIEGNLSKKVDTLTQKAVNYEGNSIGRLTAETNPTNWKNGTTWTSLVWQNGRQLKQMVGNGKTISYTYDVAGIRDSKTVNGTTYTYLTQNGQVVRQTGGGNTLDFIYDNQGRPYALVYNNVTYYYVLNLQGDVIRIVNSSGGTVADYVYDAWGNPLNGSNYASTHLYHINPIRYRGYYYDTETGLYYVSSRYYDPVVKRFINADSASLITENPTGFTDKNLFAYCDNNPVIRQDTEGELWEVVGAAVVGGAIAGALIGAGSAVLNAVVNGDDVSLKSVGLSTLQGAIQGGIAGLGVVNTGAAVLAASANALFSGVVSYASGASASEVAISATASFAGTFLGGVAPGAAQADSFALKTAYYATTSFYISGSIEGLATTARAVRNASGYNAKRATTTARTSNTQRTYNRCVTRSCYGSGKIRLATV